MRFFGTPHRRPEVDFTVQQCNFVYAWLMLPDMSRMGLTAAAPTLLFSRPCTI